MSTKKDMLTVELKQNELLGNRLKVGNGIKLCKMVLAQYIGMNGEEVMIDTTLTNNIPEPSAYLVDHASERLTIRLSHNFWIKMLRLTNFRQN